MNEMVVVWMPVFNEAAYLAAAIESVLAQSFRDFTLLISDNHSTDGSGDIAAAYAARDHRVRIVRPDAHCTSLHHIRWLFEGLLKEQFNQRYSIFIGGHDIWHFDYLRRLVEAAEGNPASAIVYSNCSEIDGAGKVINSLRGYVHVAEQIRPMIPLSVLTSLTHNLVFGGLWRESIRRRTSMRYQCSAVDHLMVTEMALMGEIVLIPDALMFLRRLPEHGNAQAYKKKHLGDDRIDPNADMAEQLQWVRDLVAAAAAGDVFFQQPAALQLLETATISAYIARYWNILVPYEDGVNRFFGGPEVQRLLALHGHYGATISEFIAKHLEK